MAAQRIEIDYLRAALRGRRGAGGHLDREQRCAAARRAALPGAARRAMAQTLARAQVDYVCINLDTGRAARMPQAFAHAYVCRP